MAILWYDESITPDIKDWTNLTGASDSGDYKTLATGGGIYTEIVDSDKLIASKYCLLELNYALGLTNDFNYENIIYVVLEGHYENGSHLIQFRSVVAVNKYNSSNVDYGIYTKVEIDTQGLPIHDLKVYVYNNYTSSIEVRYCRLRKSQDNNNEQTTEQISNYFYNSKLLEVDVRTANKLKVKYSNGTVTFDWIDDTTNHVVTVSNGTEQILLKY